jgi:diadenosine tetraphosphate (Ap4A) HIT family hydrolase/ribosomal protein S18 acetylase RimI-like enzyme
MIENNNIGDIMLIRFATEKDLPAWYELASEILQESQRPSDKGSEPSFISYAKSRVSNYEALTAVDYMSGNNMGFIGFSRARNHISWLGVAKKYRRKGAGSRLLKTALRQLDHTKPITAEAFFGEYKEDEFVLGLFRKFGFIETKSGLTADLTKEKRGGSFHYKYPEFMKASEKEHCPVCNQEPAPLGHIDIETNDKVWICGEYPGQGRLFGKMYVMPRKHCFHFEDMSPEDMTDFMNEVRRVGSALRKVTGAVKINYEMHSNSGAHLHIHLFPRYLDDEFPSAPIDYREKEPAPYESYEEFLWFVERMRKELGKTGAEVKK